MEETGGGDESRQRQMLNLEEVNLRIVAIEPLDDSGAILASAARGSRWSDIHRGEAAAEGALKPVDGHHFRTGGRETEEAWDRLGEDDWVAARAAEALHGVGGACESN